MRRFIAILVIIYLCAGSFGCVTTTDKGAVTGAGTGAILGAVVGAIAGDGKGAAIGAAAGMVAGAILGSVVANYIDKQETSRSESIRETGYTPAQGNIVEIKDAEVKPANVKPGDDIGLKVRYHVLSPDSTTKVDIRETRQIYYNGQSIFSPLVREVVKDQGQASSTAMLTLQEDMQDGEYKVVTTIDNGRVRVTKKSKFYVHR